MTQDPLEYPAWLVLGRAAHVRHVRRHGARSGADRPQRIRDAAVRGPRHAAVSSDERRKRFPPSWGPRFAFLGGYAAIAPNQASRELLPYACVLGVGAVAGLAVRSACRRCLRYIGAKKVMRFFPPIVTGPIIICIRHEPLRLRNQRTAPSNWGIAAGSHRSWL